MLTVVVTGIDGFTDRVATSTPEKIARLLDDHERLLLPVVRHFQGRVIKTLGDAFLLTFDSATSAVHAAGAMQACLAEHNQAVPAEQRFSLRIAVDTGEVELLGDPYRDVFGAPVNTASILEPVAEPGKVYLTSATATAMSQTIAADAMQTFELRGTGSVSVHVLNEDEGHSALETFRTAGTPSVETLSGEFSKGLLAAAGRQAARHSRPSSGKWVFAAAALLVAGAGAWAGVREIRWHLAYRQAQQLIEAHSEGEAIALLHGMHEQRPANTKVNRLLVRGMSAQVSDMLSANRIEDAKARLAALEKELPGSDEAARLAIDVAVYEALAPGGVEASRQLWDLIKNRYRDDPRPRIIFIEQCLARPDMRLPVQSAAYYGHWLLEKDPGYRNAEWALPLARKALYKIDPGHNEESEAYMDRFYDELRPDIVRAVYDPDPELRYARFNGHLLFMKHEPDDFDALRYHTVEFLADAWRTLEYRKGNLDYLERQLRTHPAEELRKQMTFEMPHPTVLEHITLGASRRIAIFAELYAPMFEDELITMATSPDTKGNGRLMSFHILDRTGRVSDEIRTRYHQAQINGAQWGSAEWQEGVRFFISTGSVPQSVQPDLQRVFTEASERNDPLAAKLEPLLADR